MDLLEGIVQPYAWGARDVIAELQGRRPDGGPEAELWLGAHPVAPARLAADSKALDQAVDADPTGVLGSMVLERFGRFPYLVKVLAAAEPLSIQAHPSLAQARAGWAREEAAGVPRTDPTRTYRDDNHKPELLCALTPFEAKCGFRHPDATAAVVQRLAERAPDGGSRLIAWADRMVGEAPADQRVAETLAWLLGHDGTAAAALVADLVAAAAALGPAEEPGPESGADQAELWWLGQIDRVHPGDIGVAVSLLLNHVSLRPGQAVFLSAGNLHAYLRGAGIEVMANSDNVIRGGLTVKHIDVDELLVVVDTTPTPPPVETAGGGHHRFQSPVPEFELHRYLVAGDGEEYEVAPVGPEIVLVTDGEATLRAAGRSPLVVGRGQAGFVAAADGPYRLELEPGTVAWRTGVGVDAEPTPSS